jgi:phosphohistidine phosphatase
MNLYVIRHADAGSHKQDPAEDAERPLTAAGLAQMKKVAKGMRAWDVRFDAVVASPLLRARQTAEELLRNWSQPVPELRVCEELAPGGKRRLLARFLREQGGEALAVVGHEPDLSTFAAWLIGSKKAQIQLEKAGVACIICEDGPRKGAGSLAWLATPGMLGA